MKTIRKGLAVILSILAFMLILSPPGNLRADNKNHRHDSINLTGNSDWAILPAALTPAYIFSGTDGDIYIRNMPLIGNFSLSGNGTSISGKIHANLDGELDQTFSGLLWAPIKITAKINGATRIIFEGPATADTVGLVSIGTMKLHGRGPYEGTDLDINFEEIGPGNTDTYKLKAVLSPKENKDKE